MRRILTIIILSICAASASAMSLAQQGDSAYNSQNYEAAARYYSEALANDGVSAELYYNLGNAYYKLGNLGHAVISYQRALKLNPSMTDARANLEFVNTKILDKPEDDSSFLGNLHYSIMAKMQPNAWAWTAFGLFVCLLGCVALYIFSGNIALRKTGFFGGACILVVFIYVTVIAGQSSAAYYDHDSAVVIVPTANMCTTPGAVGKDDKVIPIHEGTVVEIVDSLEIPGEMASPMWYDVKINNATRAWVRATDVERI